jgi:hypothetical protein
MHVESCELRVGLCQLVSPLVLSGIPAGAVWL